MTETLAQWLMKKYAAWIQEVGSIQPQGAFAKHLGIHRVVLSRYMNGDTLGMEISNALKVARALNDYEIFDVLGYERPADLELLAGLPSEIRTSVMEALSEARSELVSKGITTGGPEAAEIVSTAFARHGLSLNVKD